MRVSVEFFKGKRLATGEYPVLIRLHHKTQRKYISTGVSCRVDDWHKTRKEVKKSDKEYLDKNAKIQTRLTHFQDRAREFEKQGLEIDLGLLISESPILARGVRSDLLEVMREKADNSKYNTKVFLGVAIRTLQGLGFEKIPLQTFSQADFERVQAKVIKAKEGKYEMTNKLLKCLVQSYGYAVKCGYVDKPKHIKARLVESPKPDKGLDFEECTKILQAYKDSVRQKGSRLDYKNDKEDYALRLFILMLGLQGIPPIDLALLRVGDISDRVVNSVPKDYERYARDEGYKAWYDKENKPLKVYEVNYRRKKTGIQVKVITDYNSLQPILEPMLLGRGKNELLISHCLTSKQIGNDEKALTRKGYFFSSLADSLNKFLVFSNRVTYYDARRMFSTMLYYRGVPENHIQQMIGHKTSNLLDHYVKPISPYDQARAIGSIFLSDSLDHRVPSKVRDYILDWHKEQGGKVGLEDMPDFPLPTDCPDTAPINPYIQQQERG